MAHHPATVLFIAVAASISLVLTGIAWGAYRRTGDRRLLYLLAAFALFATKSALTAYSLYLEETDRLLFGHEDLEALGAAFDLLVLLLLVAPLAARRPPP